jgi:hypothetical protein
MFFVHVIVIEGKEIDRLFVENNYLLYFRLFERVMCTDCCNFEKIPFDLNQPPP